MKTQGRSGSQDKKEIKTASSVTTIFSDKKSPQRKFASAKIANPVNPDEWSNNELIKIT